MANIGYVRVSTVEQNTGRQFALLQERGIKLDKVYEEKVSATFGNHYKDWKAVKINGVKFRELEGLKKSTFYKLVKKYVELNK